MKTEITKIKGDWIEVASDCRSTVGKPPLGISYDPKIDAMMRYMGCAAPLRVAGLKGGALADAAAALSGAPLSAEAIEHLKALALADAAAAVQMAQDGTE